MSDPTYNWVSEGSIRKYNRAVELLRKEKKEITEEAVKELYVKWGGLLLENDAATETKATVGGALGVAANTAPLHHRRVLRPLKPLEE